MTVLRDQGQEMEQRAERAAIRCDPKEDGLLWV
jgi:hypothetical protein